MMKSQELKKKESTSSTGSEAKVMDSIDEELFATQEMCKYCFNTLLQELVEEFRHQETDFLQSLPSSTSCPLFVTWEKSFSLLNPDYNLRGCIGTLSPRQLSGSLGEYAKISAFQDTRFNPISLEEVANLRVTVSLLIRFQQCSDCFEWDVGVHGIIIKFNDGYKNYSATFLPEVAHEQKWSKRETIQSLVKKAGYHRRITNAFFESLDCTRYESSKHRLSYPNYVAMTGTDPLKSR